ncbi:uncharacterized protein LOC112888660 [Panicum hallii]|uniref:uncharacterized protein LOC112888660 n=1 Tax=Panicum hallii TaxID=206008 RepID=UPI000DF4D70F|nr:uncharacterized protein LOC112888660 [Panicum hallii]
MLSLRGSKSTQYQVQWYNSRSQVQWCLSCAVLVPSTYSLGILWAYRQQTGDGNSDCSKKEELVLPTDSKHDSAKFSEDSSQEVRKCSELRASDLAAPLSDEQLALLLIVRTLGG